MCETMLFFQCPSMCRPLDSATPGRPLNVPFFRRERYVFMFLCEKIVPVDMALFNLSTVFEVSDVGRGNLAISTLLAFKKIRPFLRSTYYWMSRSTFLGGCAVAAMIDNFEKKKNTGWLPKFV
jgi:hypothetical protein